MKKKKKDKWKNLTRIIILVKIKIILIFRPSLRNKQKNLIIIKVSFKSKKVLTCRMKII